MNDYKNANLKFWDATVPEHVGSNFYDVEGFLGGRIALDDIEINEVGGVSGDTLLHLQCHFGLSTLSWARLGAVVTGVDFSPAAIATANGLSEQSGLSARFVESNIYDLSANISEQFDVVFTSYGVLCWLPDLSAWAKEIANRLKCDGRFHLVEYHPLMTAVECGLDNTIIFNNSYFNEGVEIADVDGSYASSKSCISETTYEWSHSLGEVVTSLIDAGLTITSLKEYPYATDGGFVDYLHRSGDRKWKVPNDRWNIPLTYSIGATKR